MSSDRPQRSAVSAASYSWTTIAGNIEICDLAEKLSRLMKRSAIARKKVALRTKVIQGQGDHAQKQEGLQPKG